MVLFNNSRDQGEIQSVAPQGFPTQVKYFLNDYREATKKDHRSILLHLHPVRPDRLRVRRSICKPDELEIYAPSGGLEEQSFDL